MRAGRLISLGAFGAALCVTPVAFAQAPDARPAPSLSDTLLGSAKLDYEAGRRLYESGDYAGAVAMFKSASRESGDPRLFWNAAVCERAMEHYAQAVALVNRYLESRSPLISVEAERDARDFLAAAEAHTAHLDVAASEAGATVTVDGERLGVTPLTVDVRIDLGTHRVTVTKDGFAEYSTTLSVVNAGWVHLTAVLTPTPAEGALAVRAGRGDAIEIDGKSVGLGTWTGALPIGLHTVRVTEPDSSPFETDAVVDEHKLRSIDVTLRPLRRGAALPVWVWIAGSAALAAGAVTVGYFALKTSEPSIGSPQVSGSIDTVHFP